MVERYFRVYVQRERLYTEGAPLIIEAVAVLKDNVTGQKVGQVKFRGISSEAILSVKARVQALDGADREIGKPVEYEYLNLSVQRDDLFGQKEAVPLSEPSALGIKVEVVEVVFHNKTVWNGEDKTWSPIPKLPSITSVFQDWELVKQYERELGSSNAYFTVNNLFTREKDLWFCACGELNRADETKCFKCKRGRQIQEMMDFDLLKKHKEERLAEEQKEREEEEARREAERKKLEAARREQEARRAAEEEQRRIEEAKRRKKAKRRKLILGTICVIIVAGAVVTVKVIIPSQKYDQAQSLIEEGKYIEAAEAFDALENYSDSAKRAAEARQKNTYISAKESLEKGDYQTALTMFTNLGDYEDAEEYLKECTYCLAVELMEKGRYNEAAGQLQSISGYKDADEQNRECQYQIGIQYLAEKRYTEAEALLKGLGDYKDSQTQLEECQTIKTLSDKLAGMKEGDEISFGIYEQDNNTENGKEEILWEYVARDGNKVLLLSKNALDLAVYNEEREETTWEACTLRKWLNDDFYNEAFNNIEKTCIISTNLTSAVRSMNDGEKKVDEVETQDNVFVLGYEDIWTYVNALSRQTMSVTAYAIDKVQKEFPKQTVEELKRDARVWMRDSYTGEPGALGWNGRVDGSFSWNYVDVKAFTVRPTIWVEVEENFGEQTNDDFADLWDKDSEDEEALSSSVPDSSTSSESGNSYSSSNRDTGNKCHFKENGEEVCDSPCAPNSNFCSYHTEYLNEIYNGVKDRYDNLTDD